jgi:YHS domain-containing protein
MAKRRDVLHMAPALLLGIVAFGNQLGVEDAAQAAEPRLALKGYDPVAYFTEGRPMLGKKEFEYIWDEARYYFASDYHMSMFRSDPDRYTPQFAGSCAMGMSKGVKVEANPENWLISDGRLFVFYPADGPTRFQSDTQATAAAADRNWQLLKDASFGTSLGQ